jgi:zinc protease
LNTLLGGGMSSRLFLTLREELGLAYEVSSFFPTRQQTSHWVIYLGLSAEKLALAERKLLEILDDLAEKGPLPAEVAQAKSGLVAVSGAQPRVPRAVRSNDR